MAYDRVSRWRYYLHASHILETEELPIKPPLSLGLHRPRSLLDQRRYVVLQLQNRGSGPCSDPGNVHRLDDLRVPDQV